MFESFILAIIRFSVRINKGFLMVTGCILVTYIGCCHHDPLLQSIKYKIEIRCGEQGAENPNSVQLHSQPPPSEGDTILVAPKPRTELCPLWGLVVAPSVSLAGFPWESHMANIHVMVDVLIV